MKTQLIRNATLKIEYNKHQILLDPFFSSKGSLPAFAGIAPNPTVDLPVSKEEILDGVELILLSHLHPDHFDEPAQEALPKFLPVFCAPVDQPNIEAKGFTNVSAIKEPMEWEGITVEATFAQHGTGDWLTSMGHVTGFLLSAPNRPSLYLAGDTVLTDEVRKFIKNRKPNVIVTNSGGAHFPDAPPIIMGIEQTLEVCTLAPKSKVIATHLEALDHCPVTRTALRSAAKEAGHTHLIVPEDGEIVTI